MLVCVFVLSNYYRSQTKFVKVMFLHVSVILSTGGTCMVGGHVWQGACMAGGVRGGGHAWQGACMAGGHVWQEGCVCHAQCPLPQQILRLRHTVNERTVRILLECIFVLQLIQWFNNNWFSFLMGIYWDYFGLPLDYIITGFPVLSHIFFCFLSRVWLQMLLDVWI